MDTELPYIGDAMPKWVAAGVRVRVKSTSITRKYGFDSLYGTQDRAWPGEVGTIVRSDGNGWWTWRVEFPRGLSYRLSADRLENLVRVREKAAEKNSENFS